MGVSMSGGTPKSSILDWDFPYKPSILGFCHLWQWKPSNHHWKPMQSHWKPIKPPFLRGETPPFWAFPRVFLGFSYGLGCPLSPFQRSPRLPLTSRACTATWEKCGSAAVPMAVPPRFEVQNLNFGSKMWVVYPQNRSYRCFWMGGTRWMDGIIIITLKKGIIVIINIKK